MEIATTERVKARCIGNQSTYRRNRPTKWQVLPIQKTNEQNTDPIWLSASNYQENEEIQIVLPLLPFSSLLFRETHSYTLT
jgi:hypothetical protein